VLRSLSSRCPGAENRQNRYERGGRLGDRTFPFYRHTFPPFYLLRTLLSRHLLNTIIDTCPPADFLQADLSTVAPRKPILRPSAPSFNPAPPPNTNASFRSAVRPPVAPHLQPQAGPSRPLQLYGPSSGPYAGGVGQEHGGVRGWDGPGHQEDEWFRGPKTGSNRQIWESA
jgi:hypothetical protein